MSLNFPLEYNFGQIRVAIDPDDFKMGSDLSVVNAARVSFKKKSKATGTDLFGMPVLSEGDQKLITFLARGMSQRDWEQHIDILADLDDPVLIEEVLTLVRNAPTHWTPFSHTAFKVTVSAPIPIRTQCFKHKVGFVENEVSRRYVYDEPEFYRPEVVRVAASDLKQGSGGAHPRQNYMKQLFDQTYEFALDQYNEAIAMGMCPEQARFILPQGMMTMWVWTGNLASFARFYNQRTDPHAQHEVGCVAKACAEMIAPHFPYSWKALTNG